MELLPDLGTYLVDHQIVQPFILKVFNDLYLGQDRVLGWAISGSTRLFAISALGDSPLPHLNQPYLFTIYLGRGSRSRAEQLLERLKHEGLPIVPRPDKQYLVPSGKETVVPLQYLKP
jgi:hypothetical protein